MLRWSALIPLLLMTGCGTVEYRINEFSEMTVLPRPDLLVTLNAYGSWTRLDAARWVEVRGSPYTMDLRIQGSNISGARIGYLRVLNPAAGSSTTVVGWDDPVHDRSTGAIAVVNRKGVELPADTVLIEALLVVFGETTDTLHISGALDYQFRVEKRNRLLEHVRGL